MLFETKHERTETMRILLCSPLDKGLGNVQNWGAPSLAIMRLTGYLRKYEPGHEIETYDPNIDKWNPHEAFRGMPVDILGISVMHFTLIETIGFIHQWKKEHPESLIICGGIEVSGNSQQILDNAPVDILVLGEGEEPLRGIVQWREGKRTLDQIPGIIWRKYSKPSTDHEYAVSWNAIDFSTGRYEEYWASSKMQYPDSHWPEMERRIKHVRLLNSSLCCKRCTYCSLRLAQQNNQGKVVTPATLKGEQIYGLVRRVIHQVPDVGCIYFVTDDVFFPRKDNFHDFIKRYTEWMGYDQKPRGIRFMIQTSVSSLEETDFLALKSINTWRITLGVENCSRRIRESLCKYQDDEKIERIIGWAKQYGIDLYMLFMLFPPESTLTDLWINYHGIKRYADMGVNVSVEPCIYAYRGTPIFDQLYDIHYELYQVPGTSIQIKDAKWILPRDETVRRLMFEFKTVEDHYVNMQMPEIKHRTKGQTGILLVQLLGELLEKYDPNHKYDQ